MSIGLAFLRKLQDEAVDGFHRDLSPSRRFPDGVTGIQAWVDDNSSVARALKALDQALPDDHN